MAMGVAFVSGFLKGMNDVAREKNEKLLKEQELEAERKKMLGGWVVELAKSKNVDTNSEGFKNLASEAGLSGLANISNTMGDIDSSINYGNAKFVKPKDFDKNILLDNQMRAGGTWLTWANNTFADENSRARLMDELNKNPMAKKKFVGDLQRYSNLFIDGQILKKMETQSGDRTYIQPESAFNILYSNLGDLSGEVGVSLDEKVVSAAAQKGEIKNPSNALVFTFTTGQNEAKKEPFDFTDTELNAITTIAQRNGYDNPQEYINNFKDVVRADTGREAYQVLITAAEFETKGYGQLNLTGGGSAEMRAQLGNDLIEEFGDDPYMQAQSIVPLVTIQEDKYAAANKRKGYTVQLKAPEDYFARNKLSREKVMEQYEASNQALAKLNQLKGLIADDMTPTGLKAAFVKVGFGIFGEGGQAEQIFGNFNLDTETGTTPQNLIQGAIDKGFLSAESARNLSTVDALKLSLAAEMARAVDPSGRLSNQDFEIQLQRLGQSGLFTSKVQAGASLDAVISDFQRTQRRLVLLNEVATADSFGLREARLLKADRIARQALNAAYRMSATAPAATAPVPAAGEQPQTGLTLDPSGFYTDGNNNWFRDEAGTQPANMNDVLKAMGAGEKS